MTTYPGLPVPIVCDYLSRERSTRPAPSGIDLSELPLDRLADLDVLPAAGFRFSAVPVKLKGMGTFPVRAYATIEDPPAP
jgi:arylformamidase